MFSSIHLLFDNQTSRVRKASRACRFRCQNVFLNLVFVISLILFLPGVALSQDQASPGSSKASSTEQKTENFGSQICGPRCVQRVLAEYGQDVDLLELVKEIQWPATENGSSFEQLAQALEKRGIHSKSVVLKPPVRIEWNHPAIVQINQGDVSHFVVWMPPSKPDSIGRVWDESLTDAVKAPGGFEQLRSGPVLLTSDQPILETAVVGSQYGPVMTFLKSWSLPAFLSALAFGLGRWFFTSKTSRKTESASEGTRVPTDPA